MPSTRELKALQYIASGNCDLWCAQCKVAVKDPLDGAIYCPSMISEEYVIDPETGEYDDYELMFRARKKLQEYLDAQEDFD